MPVIPYKRKTRKLLFWGLIATLLLLSFGHISVTSSQYARAGTLVINEFMAANGNGLMDEDGNYSDWVEIYNPSRLPINLSGWSLTNDPNQPVKWPFPNVNIDSGEYLIVFTSGKNKRAVEPGAALHTNFRLARNGGFLGLHNVLESKFADAIEPFPPQLRDVAYGRYGPTAAFGYLAIPTPGSANNETQVWASLTAPVSFSTPHGLYRQPVTVSLNSPTPDVTIRYTTDGSRPTESHGQIYDAPLTLSESTLLTAVAFKAGQLPSEAVTHSYLFVDDILTQPAQPAHMPASWGTRLETVDGLTRVAPTPPDYEMSPEIVNDAAYREQLPAGLSDLPAVSLVMDGQSFAQLHANSNDTGRSAEHPVSMELILPGPPTEALPGFQVNAGIRQTDPTTTTIRKQSFQLYFRGDYGETTLNYPLFPTSPMLEFDGLRLTAADSFAGPNFAALPAPYLREAWLRRSQVAMSGLSPHGMFVHLYINGLYWGIYDLTETANADFMASYLGGPEESWFVAGSQGPLENFEQPPAQELTYLFNSLALAPRFDSQLAGSGYLTDAYQQLGSYIEPTRFNDFIILQRYAALLEWPALDWRSAIRVQDTPGQGRFLVSGDSPTAPANQEQANIPGQLFEVLQQNPDFKIQFADRVYRHFFNDGPLSASGATARWQTLAGQIDDSLAAESARWGDAAAETSLTPADWRNASEAVVAQLESAAGLFVEQARQEGLYPAIDPPQFSRQGGVVDENFALEMFSDTPDGVIYYTLDRTDPRLPVTGERSLTALPYQEPIQLFGSITVKARLLHGDTWSALHSAEFRLITQDPRLRITEVMYNPLGGDNYEFIELKNSGNAPLSLSNVYLDEGVRFIFPPNTPPLAPGQFAVLVSDAAGFAQRYPDVTISGVYDGHLSNKGEKVAIKDPDGRELFALSYNDENGWPISPDGRGDSLTLIDVDGLPTNPQNWRASHDLYGSPGRDDPALTNGGS